MGKKKTRPGGIPAQESQPPWPAGQGRFLYQTAQPYDGVQSIVKKLAEKASEGPAKWKAKIEGRVLSLNTTAREEATALVGYKPITYTVRQPFSKFSGLSNRAVKRAGLLAHPANIEYQHALALHNLWLEYVADVLGKQTTPQHIARALALCDLQGAKIDINTSECPSYVGIAGIIVRETQHAFYIVKHDSKVVMVLKVGTVFTLEWNQWKFHIYGSHLTGTPAQRSKRKLKAKGKL
ncbi:ribonuclease P subunit p29 [Babesia ovis]|uniref:Ribonuclease P subunit p29 n=1 Tax=Babesia ovis TaxID=5869 RepID=A0A9W5WUV2_BABOV|nr:ribonuclease P subunit p29 [Babesia ovis]